MRPGVKQAGFDRAKAAILAALQVEPELRGLKDSLLIEEAPEGLRVQILDRDQLPMFPVGSDAMYPHTRRLLAVVVEAIADTANRLSLRGHTDSLPFAAGSGRDNWHLSADRANATRARDDRGRARPGPRGRGGRSGRRRAPCRRSARPTRATGGSRWCSCVHPLTRTAVGRRRTVPRRAVDARSRAA